MVPPWVPDLQPPQVPTDEPARPDEVAPEAPPNRFRTTRLALGKFAGSGDSARLRRGLAQYVSSGYGGSATAAKRLGGTARNAGVLFGALSSAGRSGTSLPGGDLDVAMLSSRSADEVMNAIVEAVRPVDGTLDAEASRSAIKQALCVLLTKYPTAELLELTDEQSLFATESYLATDVFLRFQLDVGKTIQDKAPTAVAALARLKEAKEYIREIVSASFRRLAAGIKLTSRQVARVGLDALKDAFAVFTSYIQ